MFIFSSSFANPTGGQVSVGSATISSPDANTVHINQSSDKAIINWNSFNIAPNEKTHFQQPSTSSITLNRISPTQGVSQIFGQLTANGHIILINPAGVYFGPSAYVNVGGIVVSTSGISNENFMAGKYIFDQPSSYHGSVINAGTIKAGDSGLVALLGTSVRNDGLIVVSVGNVVLASGNKFTFDFSGDQLINFAVDAGATHHGVDKDGNTLTESVSNNGKIITNGGKVIMTAKSVGGVLNSTINMSGVVVAKSVRQQNGVIIFSSGGTAKVSGKVYAKGGNVKILAKHVTIDGNATINVSSNTGGGEVLIGGDYKGLNPTIENAETTFIGSGVRIFANALVAGNGGRVIVWADDYTQFYGAISAKGGPAGGNGGFVETSGKNYLEVAGGRVNASAPLGLAGTWLLDPRNVAINNSATTCTSPPCFSGGNPNVYTPDTNTSNVLVADILASLEAGTSVTITTGTTGIQVGTIAVNAAIAKTLGATAVTLTLDSTNAGGTITVSSPISSTSGALSVSLLSGNAIQINETITTNGGNFIATAQNGITLGNGTGTTPGVINAGSGTVSFNTNADGAGANNFLMNPNSSITTTNNTASAVQLLVNTAAGGTGNASLRAITAGATGKIIVSTDGTANGTGNVTGTSITTTASTTIGGGDILFIAPTTITHNGSINTAGIVSMFANTSAAASSFTMNAGSSITTTDASANAVKINVNKATGGTGTAALRDITVGTGGTITVSTDTGGNVTGGDITQASGVLTVGSTGTITLTNPNAAGINIGSAGANIQISAGTLTFITGTAGAFFTNVGTSALNLGTITTSGAFSLTSTSSSGITDSGTLSIAGTMTLVAGATQNITLNTASNDFSTIAVTSANDVILVDTNALNFGASTISGNLNVTTGGDLTDSATVSVAGTATFAVGANNITLDTATNNFNIVEITNANNVTLRDAGAMVFGNATVSGDLLLTTAGAVTQNVGTSLLVNGVGKTATFVAGAANNITLDNATNDFTSVVVTTGNNVSLRDVNAMQFGAATSTISGTLGVVTGGNLTQLGGALVVSSLATLNPGSTNSITLDNATNNFSSVAIVNASNASLRDTNALVMAASTVVNTLTLVAGNAITQSGILTVPTLIATTRLTGGAAITLNDVGNIVNSINLHALNTAGTANAAGAITFSNSQGFDVAAIGTTSTIGLTAVGAISDSGNITGSTLTTSSVGGTILDFGSNLTGFNATNITSGSIQLINTGALTVTTGISQSGNGSVDILNTGSLTLTGNLNTNGGSGAVGLHATTAMTLNGAIDAGSGTVTLDANTAAGASSFTMNVGSSITTTNTGISAVAINVNAAGGGTGAAALRDITVGNGGTISVRTDTGSNTTGGDITQASGLLNSGSTGIVTLINPHIAGNNIGTVALPIQILAGTLNALSGNNGIFVTNTGTSALTVKTLEAFRSDTNVKGNAQIISNGIIQQTGASSPINVATLTLKTLNNAGANITFNNSSNVAATINLSARNVADTADAAGTISYHGSTATAISGLETSSNATIVVNGALTDSGTSTVGGTLTVTSVGGAVLDNAKQVNAFNATNTSGGNVTFSGNTIPLTITGISQSGGGNVTISNSTNVTIDNNATISTGGGTATLTVTSGTLTLGSNATVISGGGTVTINTTDINLDPTSSLSSGAGNMTITQNTATGSIGLGNTAGTLTLSGAELERITANNLTVVAPNNGQIIVDGITGSNVSNIAGLLTLQATAGTLGSIIFQNNPSTFKTLTANTDNGLTVNTAITTTVGNLALSGGNAITLNDDLTAAGSLTLTAAAGGITLGAPVTLTGNGITFNDPINGAQDLTLNAGSTGNITFNENVGDLVRIGLLKIINVNTLTNNALINATSYTQLAGTLVQLGTSGLNLTGAANVAGVTFDGAVNVASLVLNVSFANLTGFVDGSSGRAAIAKIVNINTIGPGTHFFDGIDMYMAPPPPPPPPPYNGRIPSIAFSYLYSLLEDNYADVATELNYADLLALLDSGRKKCVFFSNYLAVCAEPTSQ